MTHRIGRSRGWTLLLLLAASSLSAQEASDRAVAARLMSRFDSIRTAFQIPGLAVVLLRDTVVLGARGFGLANVEQGIPVTPETPFNIASVAKPIGAVVALRLVEKGVLNLDRPMQSYQGFKEFCEDVLPSGGIFFSDYACRDSTLTLRHVLSMQANGAPGSRFLYNPPSYSWASRPMAEMAETTFSELTARLVFGPAGMTHSGRQNRRLPLRADLAAALARPYHVDSTGRVVASAPPGPQGDGAAGGVIASAMDLARFDIALTQGRLLSPQSLATMWTPGRSPTGATLPYGLGWFIAAPFGETLLWHTGLWEGAYSALYLKVPARHLTLILLANSDALQWQTRFDEAAVERSPFARALLDAFPR